MCLLTYSLSSARPPRLTTFPTQKPRTPTRDGTTPSPTGSSTPSGPPCSSRLSPRKTRRSCAESCGAWPRKGCAVIGGCKRSVGGVLIHIQTCTHSLSHIHQHTHTAPPPRHPDPPPHTHHRPLLLLFFPNKGKPPLPSPRFLFFVQRDHHAGATAPVAAGSVLPSSSSSSFSFNPVGCGLTVLSSYAHTYTQAATWVEMKTCTHVAYTIGHIDTCTHHKTCIPTGRRRQMQACRFLSFLPPPSPTAPVMPARAAALLVLCPLM